MTRVPYLARHKFRNPDRIDRRELPRGKREALAALEASTGWKCRLLRERRPTGAIYGEFNQPPGRTRKTICVWSYEPRVGYTFLPT